MTHLSMIGACYVLAGLVGLVKRIKRNGRSAWRVHFDKHAMIEICVGGVHFAVDGLVVLGLGGHASVIA